MQLSSVDLPQPEGPKQHEEFALRDVEVKRFSTSTGPKLRRQSLHHATASGIVIVSPFHRAGGDAAHETACRK